MIEVKNLTKRFHDFTALEDVSCSIGSGCIYGMVGSNGAGKSTFLRALTGVYQPDAGKILIDGQPVWDNPAVKRRIAYVPDELYFLAGANLNRMERMYQSLYPDFDKNRFEKLCGHLQLPRNKSLGQFSKGMRRQAATILALSCRPDYLFFDETFDGLDPVMRSFVKKLIWRICHYYLPLPAGTGGYLRPAGTAAQRRSGAGKRHRESENFTVQDPDRFPGGL